MRFLLAPFIVFLAGISLMLVQEVNADDVPPEQRHPNSCLNNQFALTFDDGPTNLTKTVVKQLVKANQKATFFRNVNNYFCSYDQEFVDANRFALQNGMTIASHTAGHPDMTKLTDDQARFQIEQTNLYLNRTLGIVPRFFRFPYGSTDDRLDRIVREEFGMISVFWGIATGDADGATEQQQVDTFNKLDKNSNDIVLMHDTNDSLVTGFNVLKKILVMKKKQMKSVEMSKCLGFYDPRDAYLYYKPHNNKRDASWTCDNIPIGDPNNPVKPAKTPTPTPP